MLDEDDEDAPDADDSDDTTDMGACEEVGAASILKHGNAAVLGAGRGATAAADFDA
jgi:hypothetical protein